MVPKLKSWSVKKIITKRTAEIMIAGHQRGFLLNALCCESVMLGHLLSNLTLISKLCSTCGKVVNKYTWTCCFGRALLLRAFVSMPKGIFVHI